MSRKDYATLETPPFVRITIAEETLASSPIPRAVAAPSLFDGVHTSAVGGERA